MECLGQDRQFVTSLIYQDFPSQTGRRKVTQRLQRGHELKVLVNLFPPVCFNEVFSSGGVFSTSLFYSGDPLIG